MLDRWLYQQDGRQVDGLQQAWRQRALTIVVVFILGFLQIPRWCSFGSTTLVLVNAYGVAYTLTLRALVKIDGSGDAPFGRAWLALY